jgi:DNA-binding NtrC family response regulator
MTFDGHIHRFLVVDDEPNIVELIKRELNDFGYDDIYCFTSPKLAMQWAQKNSFNIAIVDYQMPEMNGLDLIDKLQSLAPDSYYILITGYAELQTSIKALRMHIFDMLQKPISSHDIELFLGRLKKHMELKNNNTLLQGLLKIEKDDTELLGRSNAMQEIREKVELFAKHFEPVFITGETGVGKEVVAREIHARSHRDKFKFVAINCSAYLDTLLESEMFGHEKGSFTGAEKRRMGKFEFVGKGTILLDEICEIPPHIQVKLLRVLQEKEFERVGGNDMIPIVSRLVSATNRNIEEALKNKWLREDFYYRLNKLHIHIPPLRERIEDIEYFAIHFLLNKSLMQDKIISTFTDEAMSIILSHSWPGNVRQLQSVMDYAVLCCDGDEIDVKHFPTTFLEEMKRKIKIADTDVRSKKLAVSVNSDIANYEREMIMDALEAHNWNRTKAAKALGYTRTQMSYRMKKYKIGA